MIGADFEIWHSAQVFWILELPSIWLFYGKLSEAPRSTITDPLYNSLVFIV